MPLYFLSLLQAHHNATACQLLGNLCAMALHDRNHPACDLLFSLSMRERVSWVPHLYFSDRMTTSVPKEEDISNIYNVRNGRGQTRLNFTVAEYNLRGELVRLETVPGAFFQMCNSSYQVSNMGQHVLRVLDRA